MTFSHIGYDPVILNPNSIASGSAEVGAAVQPVGTSTATNDYNHRIFFDDLPNNLYAAHNIGWETVWIHPDADNNLKPYYVDHAYKNIVDALENINLN